MKTRSVLKGLLFLGALVVLVFGFGKSGLCASYTEYKLGMTVPRSGDQKFVGDMQLAGVELAVEEINARGGIDGVPIKLIVEDNQAKPTVAVTAFQKLITVDKVPLVFTTYSPTQLAQGPLADRNKVVMVNTGASSTELINAAKYMFHVAPNAATLLRILVNHASERLGLKGKRWAVLYVNDAMGKSYNTYFRSVLPKYNVNTIFSDNWEAGPVTDFRPQISKTMQFKPDVVFLGGYGKEVALCLKQLKEAGYTGQILSAWGGDLLSKEVGPKMVMNVFYAEQVVPENERIKALRDKILNVRKLPMFSAAMTINGYDSVYFAAEAIKYAKDNYKGDYFTGEKLRQAMLDKKQFTTLSSPGILDPSTQLLSRQLEVKTFKEQGEKAVEATAQQYSSKEIADLPDGKLK